MKTISLPFVGVFVLALGSLFGAACGSEVQGGSTSSGSTSSSSSTSSGSSTGDPALDCADACHKYETMNCNLPGGSDCNTICTEQIAQFPMECADQVAAYFACLAQNTTTCDFPTECNSAQMALDTCQNTYGCSNESTCFGGGGMNGETSCGCDETCKGKQYSTNCTTPAGSTMTTCDCLLEGMSVGMCTQDSMGGCGAQDSCCNAMFFNL